MLRENTSEICILTKPWEIHHLGKEVRQEQKNEIDSLLVMQSYIQCKRRKGIFLEPKQIILHM